jgi:hypothetical protein
MSKKIQHESVRDQLNKQRTCWHRAKGSVLVDSLNSKSDNGDNDRVLRRCHDMVFVRCSECEKYTTSMTYWSRSVFELTSSLRGLYASEPEGFGHPTKLQVCRHITWNLNRLWCTGEHGSDMQSRSVHSCLELPIVSIGKTGDIAIKFRKKMVDFEKLAWVTQQLTNHIDQCQHQLGCSEQRHSKKMDGDGDWGEKFILQ